MRTPLKTRYRASGLALLAVLSVSVVFWFALTFAASPLMRRFSHPNRPGSVRDLLTSPKR